MGDFAVDWSENVLAPALASILSAAALGGAVWSWTQIRSSQARIYLKLKTEPDSRFDLVMSHVRDGKDEVAGGPGKLLNEPRPFKRDGSARCLFSITRYRRGMGFQFKCYVDYPPQLHDAARHFLDENGFVDADPDETLKTSRIWFLLPEVPTCTTADRPPYTNNFFHPGLREVVHAAEQAN